MVAVLSMGITVTERQSIDKAEDFQTGDCQCVESACPGVTPGPTAVPCSYAEVTGACSCPAQNYVFFVELDPRQRICEDGPNFSEMGCECKCDGPGNSPDCLDCFSTCETIQAVAPNPDPCTGSNYNQIRCEGLPPQYPPTTCEPKIPHAYSQG